MKADTDTVLTFLMHGRKDRASWLAAALLLTACGFERDADMAPTPSSQRARAEVESGPSVDAGATAAPCSSPLEVKEIPLDAMGRLHWDGARLLVRGSSAWSLFDAATASLVAEGRYSNQWVGGPVPEVYSDMAGTTMLVPVSRNLFALGDAATGRLTAKIDNVVGVRSLAVDGSYAYANRPPLLGVWNRDGQQILTRPGQTATTIFADRDLLRIAPDPAWGEHTIETVRLDGTSIISPPYVGDFVAWFSDGLHFVTVTDTHLRVYTSEVREVLSITYFGGANPNAPDALVWPPALGGHGDYLWIAPSFGKQSAATTDRVDVFRIGTPVPITTFRTHVNVQPSPPVSATTSRSGVMGFVGRDVLFQLDLRSEQPRLARFDLAGVSERSAYASDGQGRWAVADGRHLRWQACAAP